MSPDRREFVRQGVVAVGGAAVARLGAGVQRAAWAAGSVGGGSTDVRIDVLPGEPIGPVTAALYGHFIEHLGAVVYDGVWVGEKSSIPNIGGLRKQLVDDLRALGPGIVRWPGGCFADSYDWRDGVGPVGQRKRRLNFWGNELPDSVRGASRYEPNAFGTPEFMRFCKLVGAEPYLAVNARGMRAQDWVEWVDYCNAPAGTTSLADLRAVDGSRDPYGVRYWGIGNEAWGCGGNLTPEEYAEEYRRFAAWQPHVVGAPDPRLIAVGPNNNNEDWTRRFCAALAAGRGSAPYGYSVHSYFYPKRDLTFTPDEWYQALANPRRVATTLERQAAVLAAGRVPAKLVLDEWGDWYEEPGVAASASGAHLFESVPTLRDALVTTMMFDVFHGHADVLAVATAAQLVNCIHSLFLTDGPRYVRTPIYHAHALYQPHIGGTAVRTVVEAERMTFAEPENKGEMGWVDGVSASATVHESPKRVVVTMTNTRLDQAVTATVTFRGMTVRAGAMTTLTHADAHAHNTFERPEEVGMGATTPVAVGVGGDGVVLTLKPASATRVVFAL